MKTYKFDESGHILWSEQIDENTHSSGVIWKGQQRTRTNENGEEETYSPYDELIETGVEIEPYVAPPPSDHELKMQGVEIEGVMCSLTAEDQWGLGSMLPLIQLGHSFNFHFKNGNKIHIGPDNVESFMTIWVEARESFF